MFNGVSNNKIGILLNAITSTSDKETCIIQSFRHGVHIIPILDLFFKNATLIIKYQVKKLAQERIFIHKDIEPIKWLIKHKYITQEETDKFIQEYMEIFQKLMTETSVQPVQPVQPVVIKKVVKVKHVVQEVIKIKKIPHPVHTTSIPRPVIITEANYQTVIPTLSKLAQRHFTDMIVQDWLAKDNICCNRRIRNDAYGKAGTRCTKERITGERFFCKKCLCQMSKTFNIDC